MRVDGFHSVWLTFCGENLKLSFRIRMFLGHPDPLFRGPDPDPSLFS
jgi:hypothetical protein